MRTSSACLTVINKIYILKLNNFFEIVWGGMHQFSNPFAQYYNYNKSLFPSFGFPTFGNSPEEEIKIIGKDEFYRNKVANLIKVNEALGTFNNENNKPASFFENPDFQKRETFVEKSHPQDSSINKFNNLFDFGLINPNSSNKKVSCKKREKMRKNQLSSGAAEKVIPFIGSNIETLLLNAKKPLALYDLLDCDGLLGSTQNKRIVIGHKRTKTLYKLNKNLKVKR